MLESHSSDGVPTGNVNARERSFGAEARSGKNGAFVAWIAKMVVTFAPGLWAMLIAVVAVSCGAVPVIPDDNAFEKRVIHCVEFALPEPTHAFRMLAKVLIVGWGTVPLLTGVVARAVPDESEARFAAFAKAFATPTQNRR